MRYNERKFNLRSLWKLLYEEQTTADTKDTIHTHSSSSKTSTSWKFFINTTIYAFCLEKWYFLKIFYTQNVASTALTRAFSPFWLASPADVNNPQWFKLRLFIYSYFNCACYTVSSIFLSIWYLEITQYSIQESLFDFRWKFSICTTLKYMFI